MERKPTLREKCEIAISGKQLDNVQKETHAVSETCTVVRDEKDDRLLPHHFRRPGLTKTENNPQKHQATERKALQMKGARFRAVTKFQRTVM